MSTTEHRHLPHLASFVAEPIVYFTVVTDGRRPILNSDIAHDILRDIWLKSSDLNGWWVGDYVLMPDHVHLFARSGRASKPMREWVKLWKSLSSRAMKKALGLDGAVWQAEYFDRFLRSTDNYIEKWLYVEENPVRAGLAATPEDWPYRGRIHDLRF